MKVNQFYPATEYYEVLSDLGKVLYDGNKYFYQDFILKDEWNNIKDNMTEVELTEEIEQIIEVQEEGDDIG